MPRRSSRSGRHAGEHLIAAARALFNRAIADGYLAVGDSPAHRVVKLRRLPSLRRALTPAELEETNLSARTSGTTSSWTHCCCGYTPRRHAGAGERCR